jgi:ferric-dicitrate binding protein FerR (iron transport regulator)
MTRRLPSLLCVLFALAALFGCSRASDELAKLEAKQGTVNRDTAKQEGAWAVAAVGAGFEVGDGVRTSSAATARLKLSDGSGVTLQEKTLLRFLASPPGKKSHGLDVQTGEVALDVGREGLEIDTPSGPVTLDPGSRVKLRRTEQGTRFQVEIGT